MEPSPKNKTIDFTAKSIGIAKLLLAFSLFAAISALYLWKILRYPGEALKEFNHPVRFNFFPAISISLLLLAIATMEQSPALAKWLRIVGALCSPVAIFLILVGVYLPSMRSHNSFFCCIPGHTARFFQYSRGTFTGSGYPCNFGCVSQDDRSNSKRETVCV